MSYKLPHPFEDHSETTRKVKALESFILSAEFDALDPIDKALVREQLGHLKNYGEVVLKRSSRLCNSA